MKLLKFPEVDIFEAAIKRSFEGIKNHKDPLLYQSIFLSLLYDYYNKYEDSIEISNILTKIEELEFWIHAFNQRNQ